MSVTLRALFRGGRLALHIAAAFPMVMLFFRRPRHDSHIQRRLFQWWLRGVCRILQVRVVLQGHPQDDSLVVANHVSWLDIPVLASVWSGAFLSKEEVAGWPVFGALVRHSGTLLVRRGCQASFDEAVASMQRRLSLGGGVCMFPEGTTTDGRTVLRFRSRLFTAAVNAGAQVQPVALRYFDADGNLHPRVPFIGDDDFIPHLLRLLRGPEVRVEVVFLPRLSARGHASRTLAEFTRWQVCTAMDEQLGPATASPMTNDESLTEPRFAV